jgi:hypothetical protein
MKLISKRSQEKVQKAQLILRDKLWPKLDGKKLWLRKGSKGFTTIPRTMPLLLEIMDSLSNGKPISSAYLDLWCRAFDECFVTLNKPREMAFFSGYTGQRAEQTWVSRIKILQKLGFIDTKPGPSGQLSYALIWNPYDVVEQHYKKRTAGMREDLYNALLQRANEIKADDLDH